MAYKDPEVGRAKKRAYMKEYHKTLPGKAANARWKSTHPETLRSINRKAGIKYRENHPDIIKEGHLRSRYGITLGQFEEMLGLREGLCALCGAHMERNDIAVDHDHANGRIRGLIHKRCNHVIGYALDNSSLLRLAAEYLEIQERITKEA